MKRATFVGAILSGLSAPAAHAQVAITEFLVDADGSDAGREWLELFNFSRETIDVAGWVLRDEDADLSVLPSLTLAPGSYAVLVSGGIGGVDGATAKAVFETEWLGGAAHPQVAGIAGVSLANGADELMLLDATRTVVWSLAYADDDEPTRASWLTESSDFTVNVFGSQGAPGVVRAGDDNGVKGFAGYEQNDVAADPLAYESDVSMLVRLFGEEYANVRTGSVGSPLQGGYVMVPEGDLDNDGTVGLADLQALLAVWGPCPAPCPPGCPADLDGDCAVSMTDLLAQLANWG